jgi:fatty acid-binding protein DegV
MTDGALHPGKKYRGNMTKVIKDYTDDINENLKHANRSVAFIVHSGCDQDFLDTAFSHLKGVNDFERLYIQPAGSVISSHCGPGAFGIMYIEGE